MFAAASGQSDLMQDLAKDQDRLSFTDQVKHASRSQSGTIFDIGPSCIRIAPRQFVRLSNGIDSCNLLVYAHYGASRIPIVDWCSLMKTVQHLLYMHGCAD